MRIEKKYSTFIFITLLLSMALICGVSAQENPKTITCPNCQFSNDWASDFCINCGKSLKEAKLVKQREAEQTQMERESKDHPAEKAIIPEKAPTKTKSEEPLVKIPQQVESSKGTVKVYEGPVDPRRLFLIPTADVLGSLEISLGGGSIIGEMKEERRPFLGRASIGLGNVAELEVSTVGIITGLKEGSAAIPTAAFKLKFLPESNKIPYVGLAGALRSSLWHSERRDTVKYEKRVSTLYFVLSKTFGRASIHGGLSISDLRFRTRHASSNAFISPTPQEAREKDYVNKNIYSPFIGLKVEANPRTAMMIEFEYIPEYDFDEENPYLDKSAASGVWMIIAGVRFFIFDWLPLDTGIMYRGDYNGIGDMHIQAALNINLPLPRIVQSLRKNKR